ncbi:MAG TPA: hypothetical protein VJR94_02280 [Candidatus Nitrosocosmicus sp.]|nr:hypothetical protein [Candidatus Nitrosocosmicus sp.]
MLEYSIGLTTAIASNIFIRVEIEVDFVYTLPPPSFYDALSFIFGSVLNQNRSLHRFLTITLPNYRKKTEG